MDRHLYLAGHEAAALARGTLTAVFRESIRAEWQVEKDVDLNVTFLYGAMRFRFTHNRSYLARVGGESKGIEKPLTLAKLQAAGFADEAAFLKWASLEGITTHVYVYYLERLE